MARFTVTSTTTLVLEALRAQDDFMNYTMLREKTREPFNRVSAACHHLRRVRAIDCIIDPEGVAWWYVLPPEEDQRTCVRSEHAPYSKHRWKRKETKRQPQAVKHSGSAKKAQKN